MRPKVYLETTVPSYLMASPSRDLVIAAHQQITQSWWASFRPKFDVFVSQLVLEETSQGDPGAAARRLAVLEGIPLLAITIPITEFAEEVRVVLRLPSRAAADALHVAVAVVHRVQYLLTWNCAHIANASLRKRIESLARAAGYEPPVICTPEELTHA